MRLAHGIHLGYSTNVHPAESWAETLEALNCYTLKVKAKVCPDSWYGIGLRLSDLAARELSEPTTLSAFRRWLDAHECYVFTINGFPFGRFHGIRVKEQVYRPDWSTAQRLDYTNRLFDLLATLLPEGMEGSVSTLPGSFKAFIQTADQAQEIQANLWRCVEHVATLSERTSRDLHLGLEPEPLGYFENTAETLAFFHALHERHPNDPRLTRHLGINYDTCHFAVEFEDATASLEAFRSANIRVSKIHLSNALHLTPTPDALEALQPFADDTYLHQIIVREPDGTLHRFRDLDEKSNLQSAIGDLHSSTCRVHFHIPLHTCPAPPLHNTQAHVTETLDLLAADPTLCSHLEMETYTWGVLPDTLRARAVDEQLTAEYAWTIHALQQRHLI